MLWCATSWLVQAEAEPALRRRNSGKDAVILQHTCSELRYDWCCRLGLETCSSDSLLARLRNYETSFGKLMQLLHVPGTGQVQPLDLNICLMSECQLVK